MNVVHRCNPKNSLFKKVRSLYSVIYVTEYQELSDLFLGIFQRSFTKLRIGLILRSFPFHRKLYITLKTYIF